MSKFTLNIGKHIWKNMKQTDSKGSAFVQSFVRINRYDIMSIRQKSRCISKDKTLQTKSALNFFRNSTATKTSDDTNISSFANFSQAKTCLKKEDTSKLNYDEIWEKFKSHFVALDCEMVENVYGMNQLARCSVVDSEGDVLLDVYVQPQHAVADYRHKYSGIKPEHIYSPTALHLSSAKKEVLSIVKGKIVVGHSIANDFKVLNFYQPQALVVDIQQLKELKLLMTRAGLRNKSNLKIMSKVILKRNIQVGCHCSVEDASATMQLFKRCFPSWAETYKHIIKARLENSSYFDDKYWKGVNEPDDNTT
uniref:RNA exonuclease 4-like n=1 Tax=Phallusia mammillata TaxID=59560 RepID=A0A6F9DRA9_9ASCI|nr:RNA exonuclease 4-like [Phallusia mammillata]